MKVIDKHSSCCKKLKYILGIGNTFCGISSEDFNKKKLEERGRGKSSKKLVMKIIQLIVFII